jgi:hypothetical protein
MAGFSKMALFGQARNSLIFLCSGVLLLSCKPEANKNVERVEEGASAKASVADNWERSRDCAAQTERGAKSADWDNPKTAIGWGNHYSPKFKRCFALVTLLGNDARHELYDPFERRNLASCSIDPDLPSHIARAGDESRTDIVTADTCDAFIDDRMDH